MKSHRVWILLLLCVLLPVRGALAAAMLCSPPGASTPGNVQVAEHHAGGHHDGGHDAAGHHAAGHHAAGHHADTPAQADLDDPAQAEASPSAQDRCNLCSSFCSATPLPSSAPHAAAPAAIDAARFPAWSVRATSFVSDGQERPPRSI